MRRCGKNGFTVLEILIGATVLAIFLGSVYQVYRGVTRSFRQSNWSLTMQTHARNGLTFLREEMQRASYKTIIKIGSVDVKDDMTMKVQEGQTTSDQVLAEWYIGIPFQDAIPNSGACFKSSVELSGGKLIYKKALDPDSPPNTLGEPLYTGRVLMENVHSIDLSVSAFNVDSATGSQLITIAVELRHPETAQFPNTKVIESTAAKVDVKVEHL